MEFRDKTLEEAFPTLRFVICVEARRGSASGAPRHSIGREWTPIIWGVPSNPPCYTNESAGSAINHNAKVKNECRLVTRIQPSKMRGTQHSPRFEECPFPIAHDRQILRSGSSKDRSTSRTLNQINARQRRTVKQSLTRIYNIKWRNHKRPPVCSQNKSHKTARSSLRSNSELRNPNRENAATLMLMLMPMPMPTPMLMLLRSQNSANDRRMQSP
jgi:hypothetical protein